MPGSSVSLVRTSGRLPCGHLVGQTSRLPFFWTTIHPRFITAKWFRARREAGPPIPLFGAGSDLLYYFFVCPLLSRAKSRLRRRPSRHR